MPDLIEPSTALTNSFPAHEVTTRARWSDQWTLAPYLRADRLRFCAAPALDEAQLSYEYGTGLREDATSWDTFDPLDLAGHYVRVEIFQPAPLAPIVWYGVVIRTADAPAGSYARPGTFQSAGRQVFTCAGLGLLLDRKRVVSSRVFDSGDASEKTIGRGIGWNLGRGAPGDQEKRPNASPNTSTEGPAIFHSSLADVRVTSGGAYFWTAQQIIEYLLEFHSPDAVPFTLDTTLGQTDFLATSEPTCQADGRSVREILDELIHRRRLASYRITVDDATNEARIVPFTFNDADLTLPDGTIIAANPLQKALDFASAIDVSASTVTDHSSRYEQVIARGERRGAVVNISNVDGTLEADWPEADEDAYNTAATAEAGYPADHDQRRGRNAAFRSAEKFDRVYSHFRLPADWDGTVQDGEGANSTNCLPTLDDEGTADPSFPYAVWPPGLRFERLLPLLQNTDYSDGAIPDGSAASTLDAATDPTFRPLALYAKDKFSKWREADKLRDDVTAKGYTFAIDAAPQEYGPGLVLRIQGGPPHLLADDEFTAADTSDHIDAEINWKAFIAVAYVLTDDHAEARYPLDDDLPTDRDLRTLIVPVPGAHLDYVPYKTIVGLADGAFQRTTGPGFIRDDRAALQAVAQLCFAWYGTDRRQLSLTYRQIRPLVAIGDLIVEIGTAPYNAAIRTVITSLEYDLTAGATSFATEFLDLDSALFSRR